jgi:hypothetical protein
VLPLVGIALAVGDILGLVTVGGGVVGGGGGGTLVPVGVCVDGKGVPVLGGGPVGIVVDVGGVLIVDVAVGDTIRVGTGLELAEPKGLGVGETVLGVDVGALAGDGLGDGEGAGSGDGVGTPDGVGSNVGVGPLADEGEGEGRLEGLSAGDGVGCAEGFGTGEGVGWVEGLGVGAEGIEGTAVGGVNVGNVVGEVGVDSGVGVTVGVGVVLKDDGTVEMGVADGEELVDASVVLVGAGQCFFRIAVLLPQVQLSQLQSQVTPSEPTVWPGKPSPCSAKCADKAESSIKMRWNAQQAVR